MKNVQPKALLFRYSSCSWHLMSKLLSANPNLHNSNCRKWSPPPSPPVMGEGYEISLVGGESTVGKINLLSSSPYGEGWGGVSIFPIEAPCVAIFRHWAIFRQCLFSNMPSEECYSSQVDATRLPGVYSRGDLCRYR